MGYEEEEEEEGEGGGGEGQSGEGFGTSAGLADGGNRLGAGGSRRLDGTAASYLAPAAGGGEEGVAAGRQRRQRPAAGAAGTAAAGRRRRRPLPVRRPLRPRQARAAAWTPGGQRLGRPQRGGERRPGRAEEALGSPPSDR